MKGIIKNTYAWSVLLIVVGFATFDKEKIITTLISLAGLFLLVFSIIRTIVRLIMRLFKKTVVSESVADLSKSGDDSMKSATKQMLINDNNTNDQTHDYQIQQHKPFIIPTEYMGGILAYSYDDAQIRVAEQNKNIIRNIPDHTKLSFKRYDDVLRIELYKDDILIGSMYDNKLLKMVFDFLKNPEKNIIAVLTSSDPVIIGLYFYNPISSELKRMENLSNSKIFKLVSNKNTDMQESIESCEEGDSVDFDYDYDKEKYLVSAGPWDIGYMPSSFNTYKEKYHDVTGRIYEIVEPEDVDEKYVVSVIVIPK